MDEYSVSKQVFRSATDPPELHAMVHKSQLEECYGGTAARVTRYWPPILPEMPEAVECPEYSVVPREEYVEFWNQHPFLEKMPREMRRDLEPLEVEQHLIEEEL